MSVRHAVLGLLAQRPRHGYELRAAFQALVGGEENWDVKPAQIYTTLARLEQGGLVVEDSVEQDAGPEKRIYRAHAARPRNAPRVVCRTASSQSISMTNSSSN